MAAVFLSINGWELPIREGTFNEDTDEGGSRTRVFSGQVSQNRRFVKRAFTGETPLLASDEAAAVRGLLNGWGNTWDFNRDATDLFSYRGHGPEPNTVGTNVAGAGYGGTSRGLQIASAGAWYLQSVINSIHWTGEWTFIAHYGDGAVDSYATERILLRDNDPAGDGYVDGVAGSFDLDDIVTFNADLGFKLVGIRRGFPAAAVTYWDNITILPYRVTDEMALEFSKVDNVFSPLPHLRVRTGLQDDETSHELLMLGDVVDTEYVQANVEGGGFAMDNERLSFLLEEDTSEGI